MHREAICFVIMSFSRNPLLEEMYTEGIKAAVELLGFRCVRVDEIEHNDRITDIVIDMIRRANFIIADMTEERPNCYYELGYAHALGKVVIPTVYRKPTLHFDVQDYNFIVYSGAHDLRERLNRRILQSVIALGNREAEPQQSTALVPLPAAADFAFLQYLRLGKKDVFEIGLQHISCNPAYVKVNGEPLNANTDATPVVSPLERQLLQPLLRESIAALLYEPEKPAVCVLQLDKSLEPKESVSAEGALALAIFIMDVSGSMTDAQKEFVRRVHALTTTWLEVKYSRIPRVRYVIHDAKANQVNESVFFNTRGSGGTRISSAYVLCEKLLGELLSTEEHEIYVFQFSDGDNYYEDVPKALERLQTILLPRVHLFGYVQTETPPYESGEYFKYLTEISNSHSNLRVVRAPTCDSDDLIEVSRALILGPGSIVHGSRTV